jgi:glycosyltransferase involved in cell wall biosynthesis
VDPYVGWVIPATLKGLRLSRRFDFNIVIVTVPFFSALIAGLLVARLTDSRLIIDYRDEWTNLEGFSKRFGEKLCRRLERAAIKFASAIVVCTDRMRSDFVRDFAGLAPARVSTIYNGFEYEESSDGDALTDSCVTMLYAGNFYGARRIAIVAGALAKLRREGILDEKSFQFHLYSRLDEEDARVIEAHDIGDLVRVHDPVAYQTIKEVMKRSDILFLPSGVEYAVPFKFFDYLSARRPILAVASRESAVYDLMCLVDCGEFAEIGDTEQVASALSALIHRKREYSFSGADEYLWESAAIKYSATIREVLNQ